MTSDPEESVRLQGFGEMTLRTAVATLMALAPRERSDAAIFRVRDGVRLASSEIAELASDWGMTAMAEVRSPSLVPDQHWPDIVRGMVREAPLPALMVAFLVGVLVARR
ncbi:MULTISPECIES: hypothetical protein [Bradyrhizobium]|uniref:hypothetical protein n=1 Tax=Bradyrhizobium TaxID=374 RepID=UPI000231DAD7|nr:hypothetical protein [Bradyrhizobium japonicum]AJA64955.1 hypothetical protein RN69_35130 [Bradyrhizobium japonicum]KMJ95768.1 hypothetical protein CF64_29825 [Bradyrhizobium japonicum]MBR0765232.1 hypothetical protein [Bradyrhizobium japonicum]MCS3538036.1 hypothetical protein [Bradyrhizobium japonicum]MCS3985877.1 hypothetical protein [Bradyrhizobium japonicum]